MFSESEGEGGGANGHTITYLTMTLHDLVRRYGLYRPRGCLELSLRLP